MQRHSCRAFLADPVPREMQERLLQMAQRTASWCNSQPWQVHITEGAATERLRDALRTSPQQGESGTDFSWPREYRGVYPERRRECGFALYNSVGIARGDREASARQTQEIFCLFGAPHVAITCDDALKVYGAIDCGAYVANFLLTATSLGVATIAQAALASRSQMLRSFFGLGDERRVVCGISFGYANMDHPANAFRTSRAEVSAAAAWISA